MSKFGMIRVLDRGRRRRVLAAVAAAMIGLGGTAVAVINLFNATAAAGAASADPPSATTVRQGPLSPQVSQSGTLGYADPGTVYGLLSGTITWLPQVGQVIKPGQTLYRVENNPVILLNGSVPASRTLSPGISDGPDIKELNQNLVTFGFDPDHQITVDDAWQDATTAAVERWQASLGQTQTGTITLGQVVFLRGAQRVTKLDATLGTGGAGGAGNSDPTSYTEMRPLSVGPEFVSFNPATTTPTTTITTTTTTTTPSNPGQPGKGCQPTKPRKPGTHCQPTKPGKPGSGRQPSKPGHPGSPGGSIPHRQPTRSRGAPGGRRPSRSPQHTAGTHAGEQLAGGMESGSGAQSGGAQSGGAGGNPGGGGGSGPSATAVLETTSTQRQVQVQLDASEQASVKVGDPAQITLPDGQSTPGAVTSIGAATGSGSGSSGPTIPVDIALKHPRDAGSLDQAPVQVQITSTGVKRALIVPVTALLAVSGDGYALETVAPNGSRGLVPVRLGLVDQADGVAQVSAPGLSVGAQVVVPSD